MSRILVITPFLPSPSAHHGCPRVVDGLLGVLAARHEVVLVHLEGATASEPVSARPYEVRGLSAPVRRRGSARVFGAWGLVRGRSLWLSELGIRHLQNTVASLTGEFDPDVVQVEHGILGGALAAASKRAIRVVTLHETAASVKEFLPLRRTGLPLAQRLDARAAVRQERRVLGLADAAVVFTDRDRHRLARPASRRQAETVTIPLGCDVPSRALNPDGEAPASLLFVGNFVHPPNVDAAIRLARQIFPRVRASRPEAQLVIVGPSPPPDVRALAGAAISVTGAVPEVSPYLNRAAIVTVPIGLGGGVRVKVLEALAAGKAVVATPLAADGIEARAGHELLVADRDEEFAAAIIGLLNDSDARRRLAIRAREWAEDSLSYAVMASRYEALYDRLSHRYVASAPKTQAPT